jgi:hypothetical protein
MVPCMAATTQQTERPRRPALTVPQPESLAALRPSQHRAERRRAAHERQSSAGYWLRRLARP